MRCPGLKQHTDTVDVLLRFLHALSAVVYPPLSAIERGGDSGSGSARVGGEVGHASDSKAGVVAVGESPTLEGLIASMGAEQEQDAVFAIETVTNVAKIAPETAERICLAGAVQGAVNGAMQHRGSLVRAQDAQAMCYTMSGTDEAMCYASARRWPILTRLCATRVLGVSDTDESMCYASAREYPGLTRLCSTRVLGNVLY
eukprot:2425961-Rhodomonas_salina.1